MSSFVLDTRVKAGLQFEPNLLQPGHGGYGQAVPGIRGRRMAGEEKGSWYFIADNLGLTATSEAGLRRLIDITAEEGARFNMKISV